MTDLRYGELEQELRGTVREMLSAQSPPEQVLARCEGGDPYDPKLWRTLAAEMGLAGLAVPERYGGGGAGWREAAVVLEELGRAVAPVPYLGSAVVATAVLRAVDDRALLTDLAAGAATAALAAPFATAPGPPTDPTVRAAGDNLTGTVRGVADALHADVLLVPTGDGLFAVPADTPGVGRHPLVTLDLTRPLCDLSLAAAPGWRLAAGPESARAVAAGLTAGAALLASEQLGVAEWCLDTTVEYVRTRYQFARPVGSFQALKHRLADLWVEIAQARAVARHAAGCLATGDPDTPVATALAQAFCAPVAVHAAEECVQLHGGIGFTWEHPAHLYLKRAKSGAIGFGTADRHRATLATLVDLPG
ncbi:MAG: acyl-CoA dehydrogenase [Micromonosporaceae bacterium]|nr:acyl-CoA dehydrogenase [Micromonosporaceae bacterium]